MDPVIIDITKVVRKNARTKLNLISRIVLIALAVIRLAIIVLNCCGIAIHLNGIDQMYVTMVIDILLLAFAIMSINCKNKKVIYSVLFVVLGFITIIFFNSINSYQNDITYYEFKGSSGNTLVVQDNSSVFSSKIKFYKKINPVMIKKFKDTVTTTNGARPIKDNKYKVAWDNENQVTFSYQAENQVNFKNIQFSFK